MWNLHTYIKGPKIIMEKIGGQKTAVYKSFY